MKPRRLLTQRCTRFALRQMEQADEWMARWRPRFDALGGSIEAIKERVLQDIQRLRST